jgi:hypothetical protein
MIPENYRGADLKDANFENADCNQSDFCGARLRGANFRGANLRRASFDGAYLRYADFRRADISLVGFPGADIRDADLRNANLAYANCRGTLFEGADFRGADFTYAGFRGARLSSSIMPDGRTWEEYRSDPLKGICRTPKARERAIKAWGGHSWTTCPVNAANRYRGLAEVPDEDRLLVVTFLALYDSKLLDKPE